MTSKRFISPLSSTIIRNRENRRETALVERWNSSSPTPLSSFSPPNNVEKTKERFERFDSIVSSHSERLSFFRKGAFRRGRNTKGKFLETFPFFSIIGSIISRKTSRRILQRCFTYVCDSENFFSNVSCFNNISCVVHPLRLTSASGKIFSKRDRGKNPIFHFPRVSWTDEKKSNVTWITFPWINVIATR